MVLLILGVLCVSQLIPDKINEEPKAHVLIGGGGTFSKEVYLIITEDSALSRDLVVDILDDSTIETPKNAAGLTYYINDRPIVIWIPKIPTTPDDYASLNHELMHTVHFIMDWVEIPLNMSTTEVYGYQMGYLTKQFYEGIEKIRK